MITKQLCVKSVEKLVYLKKHMETMHLYYGVTKGFKCHLCENKLSKQILQGQVNGHTKSPHLLVLYVACYSAYINFKCNHNLEIV